MRRSETRSRRQEGMAPTNRGTIVQCFIGAKETAEGRSDATEVRSRS